MHNSLAFFVLTRKTLNLNVSLSLQFEASLCYFWSFNLIAIKEPFLHSFPRYTQKRQTIAHEKQLLINQLIDDIPTSYT